MSAIEQQYDTFVQSHPSQMKDAILFLEQEMDRRNCKFGNEIVPTFLKPVFLSTFELDKIKNVIKHMINIFEKVSRL